MSSLSSSLSPGSSGDTMVDSSIEILRPQRQPIEIKADSVAYLGVELPRGNGGPLTPDLGRFARNVITVEDLLLMQRVAIAWDLNQPILLEGGSGIGKTETIERMCAQLNRECFYANCHDFDAETIIGSPNVKDGTQTGFGWVDGIVLQAVRRGGILFLDEYNFIRGDTRGRLHEVLDAFLRGKRELILIENNGEVVRVHPDFRLIAAQNQPGGGYGDREVLDPAQFSRFVYIKLMNELPKDLRLARALGAIGRGGLPDVSDDQYLGNFAPLDLSKLREIDGLDVLITQFVEFSQDIEDLVQERTVAADQPQPIYFSFQRDFNRVLQFVARYYDSDLNSTFRRALRYYYVNRFESELDREKIEEHIAKIEFFPRANSSRISVPASIENRKGRSKELESGFSRRGVSFISELIANGAEMRGAVTGLGGVDSAEAWEIRSCALDALSNNISSVGLTGSDSDRAWEFRRRFVGSLEKGAIVAASLAGLESERAWEMREELINLGVASSHLVRSVISLDSERAWALRQRLLSEQPTKKGRGMVVESLAGIQNDRAARMRSALAEEGISYVSYFRSLTGVWTPGSMRLRKTVLDKNQDNLHVKVGIAFSLAGLNTKEAWDLREVLKRVKTPTQYLVQSLAGINSKRTWKIRDQVAGHAHTVDIKTGLCLSVFGDELVAAVRVNVGM